MNEVITPGALVFDIGGHHGESCDKFLNHYGAGRVVSVEPSLHNFTKLAEHWRGDERVTPIHAAVLDRPGFAKISRASAQDGLTTLEPEKWSAMYPDAGFEAPEVVTVITLEMLAAEFGVPHYLKVDVEGVELAVLQGLSFKPAFVSFEFHGKFIEDALACLDLLAARGYTKASYVEEDIDLVQAPHLPLATVREELATLVPNWGNITVS
jgi:FkbM family methyltransferase